VSDHTPVEEDAKVKPFAEAEPGASAVELLLSADGMTAGPASVLGASLGTLAASAGRLAEGGVADICVFNPSAWWTPRSGALRSQGQHSPFMGQELPAVVTHTLVGGQVAFERAPVFAGSAN
jgi:dihydroorotase